MVGVGGQLLVQRTPVRARSRVTVRRTRLASPTTSNAHSRADNNTRNNRRREKSTRLHAASSKNLSGRGERGEEPSGRRLLELRSSQSTSEIETSTTLTTRIKALLESWFKIISSAFSSFSVKQALFNVAAKLQLWKLPLLPFLSTGKHLIGLVNSFAKIGVIGKKTAWTFEGLYNNYRNAVVGKNEGVDDAKVVQIMKQILSRVFKEFVEPYEFPSYHARMLEPYNYYNFGQEYVSCMVDFENSYIGHPDRFKDVQAKLKGGENVILLANHQSEADPGVWALMLERQFPGLAENIVYVAGDRVVTDPLAKPFSMGRNLLCVHSKKYLDEDPATKPAKQKQNRATLSKMQKMLNEGGTLLWIAPSGGRDRPDDEGRWLPADFDQVTVELMLRLGQKAKSKTNFYPFAMWSWKIMPPPPKVVVELGEERIINHSGVGISLAEPLDIPEITKDVDEGDKGAAGKAVTEKTWDEMNKEYLKLDEAIAAKSQAAMAAQGYILP